MRYKMSNRLRYKTTNALWLSAQSYHRYCSNRSGMWASALVIVITVYILAAFIAPLPLHAQESVNILARKGNAALIKNNNQEAIKNLSEALSVGSMPIYTKASIFNDRAIAYSREKKYELALKDFNSAIEQFPEYAIAYNNRGLLLQRLGYYKEALEDFNRAIALQPQQGATFHNRANALKKAGAENSAFKEYGKALSLLDDKSAPHLARGQIHIEHMRNFAALRELNLALSYSQDNAQAYYNRGRVHITLKDTGSAVNDLAKAVELDPQNIDYQLTLAKVYMDKGQYTSARGVLNKVMKAEPANTKAMLLRGQTLHSLNKNELALEDLDEAVALEGSAAAYAERALAYASVNMPELSAADMDTAIQKAPDTARSWVALGIAAQMSGHANSAERYYREALKKDRTNEAALAGLEELGFTNAGTGNDEKLEKAEASAEAEKKEGWDIRKESDNIYLAVNPRYNRLEIPLDLYGPKEPKVLEWTELNGNYKGFGLLRYDAGSKTKKNAHEQVVVIDLKKQKVLSIEPYRWGNKIAQWTWKTTELIVKDPDGITNTLILKKPIKRAPARVAEDRYWQDDGDGFWISKPKQRPVKKRRVKKKKSKGLFGIFGF